ncbi:MAG: amidohydrolase family protein [Deltaproteobacteria bacterium]|nr:amidohydrolase family protein [Deltaproteobacteria bacterium]
MSQHYDLLIRGGLLVDGTGAPAVSGDIAVRDGKIAALGEVSGSADRTLEADGCVVAPGFVDIHTHYDAQILWDRNLTVSPWHGVTSVVLGNCGFGVAPTRPEHREMILRVLENVEGMSLEALKAGLGNTDDWPFEQFSEYLDALEARGSAINVAVLVGHTPVRMYVMGEESTEREATEDEVAQMQALVADAVRAGGLGFSSSKAPPHVGYDGRPVPSRPASFGEFKALAASAASADGRVVQSALGPGLLFEELAEVQREIGVTVSWTALLGDAFGPDGHRNVLEMHRKFQADGVALVPQVACRPIQMEFQFATPFPLESLDLFAQVLKADHEGKKKIYRDPEFRRALKEEGDADLFTMSWERTTVSEYLPDPALEGRLLADIAAERGVDPIDLALDLALDTDLEARFRVSMMNYTESTVAELLQDPSVVLGLSDAGAHASQLCDAGFATHLLGHWVREKQTLSLEQAVYHLSARPADVFGISDRGRLLPGLAADIVIFDPDTVACGPLERVRDLPAGADRLIARAEGVRAVVVNGTLLRENGVDQLDADGALPGLLLRGGQAGAS